MDVFLSSTLDGPWGIAAALQLAAAEELTLACGLATLPMFDSPLGRALPPPRAGHALRAHRPRARSEHRGRGPGRRHRGSACIEKRARSARPPRPGCCSCGACPASSTIAARAFGAIGRDSLRRGGCSRRRGRPRSRAAGGRASAARARPGRARPGPPCAAGGRASADRATAGPAAAPPPAASDWSANSGWRSHSATMSSIGIASIHEASFSSASARCTRMRPLLNARRGTNEHDGGEGRG